MELFLVITPYIFIFIQGGHITDRLQLILPLSQGCILYLTILIATNNKEAFSKIQKIGYNILSIILVCCIFKDSLTNLSYCSRLYYTDQWTFEFDASVAKKIHADILSAQEQHDGDTFYDNVVIVGYPDITHNSTCIMGNMIGVSVYQFEKGIMNPNTKRIFYFMENLGYPVDINFTKGELAAYQTYFVDAFGVTVDLMPSYPADGYVQYVSNKELGLEYLIVKLGDDWRYIE